MCGMPRVCRFQARRMRASSGGSSQVGSGAPALIGGMTGVLKWFFGRTFSSTRSVTPGWTGMGVKRPIEGGVRSRIPATTGASDRKARTSWNAGMDHPPGRSAGLYRLRRSGSSRAVTAQLVAEGGEFVDRRVERRPVGVEAVEDGLPAGEQGGEVRGRRL